MVRNDRTMKWPLGDFLFFFSSPQTNLKLLRVENITELANWLRLELTLEQG